MEARLPRRVVVWKKPAPSWRGAVEIRIEGNARLDRGVHKGLRQRIVVARVRHRQRAVGAMILVAAALLAFGLA